MCQEGSAFERNKADNNMRYDEEIRNEHLAAVMIAKIRGEDPELAAMAGLLHDIYAYKYGSYEETFRRGRIAEKKNGVI